MFPTFFFSVLRPLTKPYAGRRSSLGASTHHCQWRLNLCFTMCSSLFPGCSRHDPIQAVVNIFGGWNLQWSYVGRENMTLSLSLESCFNSTMGKLANRRERACKVRKSCHVFHQDPPPPPFPVFTLLFNLVLSCPWNTAVTAKPEIFCSGPRQQLCIQPVSICCTALHGSCDK